MKKEEYVAAAMAEMNRYIFVKTVLNDSKLVFEHIGDSEHLRCEDSEIKEILRAIVASMAERFDAQLKTVYAVFANCDGAVIDEFPTYRMARTMLKILEEQDKMNGMYEPNFYGIEKIDNVTGKIEILEPSEE